ncbi:MAG: hypothetical protein RR365_07150 [Bacteroides sp.]
MDQVIRQAITNKKLITFSYQGHQRVVEPHILGIKDGDVQILGYQIGGSSKSGKPLPDWRRFSMNEMLNTAMDTRSFAGAREYRGWLDTWDQKYLIVTR